jgi:hypothetical protein
MASEAPIPPAAKPLSFMEKLSREVSCYRPPNAHTTPAQGARAPPKLIVVASWTGAAEAHIAKYIVKYRELYPTSQILLIKSTMTLPIRPPDILRAVLPAIPVVKSCFPASADASSSPAEPEMLIHMFSNGGSSSIACLASSYGGPLPRHTAIFDSCPGIYRSHCGIAFVQTVLPSPFAAPFVYLLGYGWSALLALGLVYDWLAQWGREHNDDARKAVEQRRVYIYSDIDRLIDQRDVVANANDAEAKGFGVKMEKFVGSAHVSHMRTDGDRYWKIVQDAWECE